MSQCILTCLVWLLFEVILFLEDWFAILCHSETVVRSLPKVRRDWHIVIIFIDWGAEALVRRISAYEAPMRLILSKWGAKALVRRWSAFGEAPMTFNIVIIIIIIICRCFIGNEYHVFHADGRYIYRRTNRQKDFCKLKKCKWHVRTIGMFRSPICAIPSSCI